MPLVKTVYPPNICANPSDRWLAETRDGGWLMQFQRFDSEKAAYEWLATIEDTNMSEAVALEYAHMFHRWANK